MSDRLLSSLDRLLSAPPKLSEANLESWHRQWLASLRESDDVLVALLTAAFSADRMAGAFAAGYQSALRLLHPALNSESGFVTLSVTEEEGNRPKHIKTRLTSGSEGFVLNGSKRWATLSDVSGRVLVCARRNALEEERPELVLVDIPLQREGITVEPMPPTKFTPEVGHCRLHFDGCVVDPGEVLPGDGYDVYIKPFRLLEDCCVSLAAAAALLRAGLENAWPDAVMRELISAIHQFAVVLENRDSASAQLLFEQARQCLDRSANTEAEHWRGMDAEALARWQRDAPLMQVARLAGGIRYKRALQQLGVSIDSLEQTQNY